MTTGLLQQVQALEKELQALKLQNEKLHLLNESLSLKLQDALRRLYGRRSEKMNPDQLLFEFIELGEEAAKELEAEEAALEDPVEEETDRDRKKKRHRGRNPLPENLPVRQEVIEPSPAELVCSCGCGLPKVRIGEKVTDELEYEPARCFIRRIVRPIYACTKHHEGVVVAELPPRPIDRGRPGPGILAHLAVSKYCDHLPLYRLEQIFAREGMDISRKTMCHWLGEVAWLLEPVVDALKASILQKRFLQADETPVQVLDPEVKGRTRRGYLWAYTVPWAEVVFDFTSTRSRAGPTSFLAGFKGHLQADGYSGYDEAFRTRRIVHIGCWAHARRGFHDAKKHSPRESLLVLGMIQKLYHIEREAKALGLLPPERLALRHEKAIPILECLKVVLEELSQRVRPESLLGKAVQYTIGQWCALERYVEVEEAEIDNNSVENAIRSVAIGRKNWLFLGSPEGGGLRAEVFYSLIGTCKRLGANPFEYLRDIIQRVSTHPASRVHELLPRSWLDARNAAPATAPASSSQS